MSTVSTHLNWGSSYIINDFYKRFIKPDASDQHYVNAARLTTVGLVIAGGIVTLQMETVAGAWKFLLALGAGTGSVYILRWFWWRINAWSEISAMIASFVVSIFLQVVLKMDTNDAATFAKVMLITVLSSSAVWITVTFMTKSDNEKTLQNFYRKVHPGGPLWKPVAEKIEVQGDRGLIWDLVDWMVGIVMIYSTLFGVGKIVLGNCLAGILLLIVAATAFTFILWDLKRRGWKALKVE
jgi:Na+/proline symporter